MDFFAVFFLKVLFLLKSAFSVQLLGWIFFSDKKKWMLDSEIFTFFKPKNDLFGEFLDPTYFRAAGPKNKVDPQKTMGTF